LQKPIDFENGSLWFDTDLWSRNISELEKQKFIELYNKILTWSREYPVRQTDWNITFHRSLEKARASIDAGFMFDMGEFASRSLWDFPTTKAMMNLEWEESKRK
jgi:hypothetical protein